jgi:glycerol uptake facilitator protein
MCAAEALGTFILTFFIIGVVHVSVLIGAGYSLWQVALVCGLGVSLAIYTTGPVSGAHLNPAITLTLAAFRGFSWQKVGPYLLAQVAGAFLAGAAMHGLFAGVITHFETAHHLIHGTPGSVLTAMCYGEYFPNPGMLATTPALAGLTLPVAMLAEGAGTAVLALVIFISTDERNHARPDSRLVSLIIGLTVALLIALFAPLTQAGFNPARDFGPRLFAYLAGWGSVAIPGPNGGWFAVYILGPILGALAGGGVYSYLIRPALPREEL